MPYTEIYSHLIHGHNAEAMECTHQRKDINTPCGTFQNTPLHICAEKGLTAIASQLLQEGIDVNAKNRFGETPLHLSVLLGHHEITELLLKNNADITVKNCHGEKPFNQKNILKGLSKEL